MSRGSDSRWSPAIVLITLVILTGLLFATLKQMEKEIEGLNAQLLDSQQSLRHQTQLLQGCEMALESKSRSNAKLAYLMLTDAMPDPLMSVIDAVSSEYGTMDTRPESLRPDGRTHVDILTQAFGAAEMQASLDSAATHPRME